MTSRRLLTPTSKVLLDAADYMEAHGHCKGNFRSLRDGSVCAVGAIILANQADRAAQAHAIEVLASHISGTNIAAWNDHPSRTMNEVVATLRSAALHPLAQQPAPHNIVDEDKF